ncbi:hypothetical protein, partial [Mesorhizobium sp.]|uniref:hypothetical protein n=1 Tax=Mesorhizobium sp. TaxID=1871066 RepID=UPI0026293367
MSLAWRICSGVCSNFPPRGCELAPGRLDLCLIAARLPSIQFASGARVLRALRRLVVNRRRIPMLLSDLGRVGFDPFL